MRDFLNPIEVCLALVAICLWTVAICNVPVNPLIAALAMASHLFQ